MRTVGRQVVRIVLTAALVLMLGLLASRLGGRGVDASASEIGAASMASLTWNGSVSSDWNTASNWTPALVPTSSDDVAIAATSTQPVLSGAVTINSLSIAAGASLSTNSRALTVSSTIDNEGTLSVVNSASTAGTLTNGGTLRILAGACCGSISFPAMLTVNGTLTNTGTIELTEQGCCNNNGAAGTAELDVSGTLSSSGAINALPGQQTDSGYVLRANVLTGSITAVGGRFLDVGPFSGGTLTSSATLTAQGAPLTVSLPGGGSFTNTGTLAASGGDITVGGGASFMNSGTLTTSNGHTVIVSGGSFVPSTGSVNGSVRLSGAALAPGTISSSASISLTAGSTVPGPDPVINNGTISLTGSSVAGPLTNNGLLQTVNDTTSTVSGTVTNDGTLRIQAGACCGHISFSATLTVSGTLTNTGTIELTEQGCCNNDGVAGTAELDVSGTLSNRGAINALPGQQGDSADVLSANVLTGSITAVGGRVLNVGPFSGGALTSSATLTAQGAPITVSLPSGGSFTNTGTLAAINGQPIAVNGGTFVPSSGATVGAVELDGSALAMGTIASGSSLKLTASSTVPGPDPVVNNGTLTMAGATITGPLTNTGLLLVVSGTTNTLGGALTNGGILRIQAGDCAVGAAPAVSGTLTNTSAGTIELTEAGSHCVNSPGASSLFVTGSLINSGTISALRGDNGGDRFLIGTISNQSGATITTVGVDLTLSSAAFTNNGTVLLDTGHGLNISDSVTLAGSGTYQANVVNSGQLTVGAPVGSLNVIGGYRQGAGATLNLTLGGTASGGFSQLTFSGPAALAGSLNTTFVNGFAPALGDSFQVLAASSVSGTFASIIAPTGFTFGGTYTPSSLTIATTSSLATQCKSELSISNIAPAAAGNVGFVSPTIQGCGFVQGLTVTLVGQGGTRVTGTNTVVKTPQALTTTLDLRGLAAGPLDVVITNPDGSSTTLASVFTVKNGGGSQVSVSIIGRTQIRSGAPQTYYLAIMNNGNDDAVGVPIWVQVPANVELSIGFNLTDARGALTSTSPASSQSTATIPYQVTVGNSTIAGFYKPYVPAGSTFVLPITMATNAAIAPFQWSAWVFPSSLTTATGLFVAQDPTAALSCFASLASLILNEGFEVTSVFLDSLTTLLNFSLDAPDLADVQMSIWQIFTDIAQGDGKGDVFTASDLSQLSGFGKALGRSGAIKDCLPFLSILFQQMTVQPVTSVDPNVKMGPQGVGTGAYVPATASLGYSVSFDNKPTATAPAQAVTVTDRLDPNLDLTNVTLGPIAVSDQVVVPPAIPLSAGPYVTAVDLRPKANILVSIRVALDSTTRVLTWTLQSLDPATGRPPTDALAGFLPAGAEGSVYFSVMPQQGLPSGTIVKNGATIVFDTNPPIATRTWTNTVDAALPTSGVTPLPVKEGSGDFPVQWSGTDSFSGISDFTVYVSVNGGPFTPWIETSDTSAAYPGQPGNTYAFYSLARSNVGNVESGKTGAEATTTVAQPTAITYTGPVSQDVHDPVTLTATLTATPQNTPIAGQTLTLGVGGQTCSTGPTDASGSASCVLTSITQTPGSSTATAAFAATGIYLASADSKPFTITNEEPAAVDSVVSAHQTMPASSFSAPALTTSAGNELVLAFVSSDGPDSPTQRVASVAGGGLAWHLVSRSNAALGTAEVWEAYANAPLSSVVVTATLQTGSYDGSITVAAFAGAAPTIAASSIGDGRIGAPGVTLTTTRANSLVWGVGHDWSHSVGRTVDGDQAVVDQFLDTSVHDTSWTQAMTGPVAAAGTVVQIGDSAPTADRWDMTAVEIVPADAAMFGLATDAIRTTDQTTPDSSYSSPPVTTSSSGELLLALVSTDGPTSPTQAVTTVSGGGLTWTRVTGANAAWGAAEIWQARAAGPVDGITVTAALANPGYEGSITVVGLTGAGAAMGAVDSGAGTSGPPALTLTTTAPGSVVWAVGHDWSHATAVQPAAGQDLVTEFVDLAVHDTSWVQQSGPVAQAGTGVNVADTQPAADRWDLAAVEVVPAS